MPSGLEWLEGRARLACHRPGPLPSVVASAEHPRAPPLGAQRAIPPLDGLGWMVAEHDHQQCRGLRRCMPSGVARREGHARLACHRHSPLASVVASEEHPCAPPPDARRAIPTLEGLGWVVAEHDEQTCDWLMRFMPSGLEWLESHARLDCHRHSSLASVVS